MTEYIEFMKDLTNSYTEILEETKDHKDKKIHEYLLSGNQFIEMCS